MNRFIENRGKISFMHIVFMFVFFASMNLFNWFYYLILIALAVFVISPSRQLQFGGFSSIALLMLGISWMVFSPMSQESIFALVKPYIYFFCFVIGSSMVEHKEKIPTKDAENRFRNLISVCASGAFVHYALNWIKNRNSGERNTVDIWTNTSIAATGQAALACFALAIAIAILFSKSSRSKKVVAIAVIVLIFLYNLILSGRTLILLFLSTCAIAFVHLLVKQKKGKIRVLLLVLLVICVLITIYRADSLGIRSTVENSPLYDRFFGENSVNELDEDGRWKQKLDHIQNMDEALWGGAHLREKYGHAHDIFFDTYDEAGIIALVGLFIYMLMTVRRLIKCITSSNLSFDFKQRVLCIYFVAYMEFMIEPILQGMPWMFALFCLIDGYVGRMISYGQNEHYEMDRV